MHTDRTWGVDIEALLKGQIETLKTKVPRARQLANEYSTVIGFLDGICGYRSKFDFIGRCH